MAGVVAVQSIVAMLDRGPRPTSKPGPPGPGPIRREPATNGPATNGPAAPLPAAPLPAAPLPAVLRLAELLPPTDDPAHYPYHVVMLTTVGHSRHSVDFVEYPCRPGTVLWARPGQVCRFAGRPGFDATLLLVPPGLVPTLPGIDALLADPFAPACWLPAGEDEEAILTEVAQIGIDRARYPVGDPIGAALLRHQLAVLLTRIVALNPGVGPGRRPGQRLVSRLRCELEVSFAATRRVEEYAARLGVSVRTLTRACLSETGRSAKQVVDARVALQAKRLLACTGLPVAEVGRQLGFAEPANFGRFFTREAGCTPGEFRAGRRASGAAGARRAGRAA